MTEYESNYYTRNFYTLARYLRRAAREWAMRAACAGKVDDIRNGGITSSTERDYSNDKCQQTSRTHYQVLLGVPAPILQQHEPHNSWDPERESRNEESRCKRQEIRENRDSFSNDPCDDGEDDD